jgi:hypothetical protein
MITGVDGTICRGWGLVRVPQITIAWATVFKSNIPAATVYPIQAPGHRPFLYVQLASSRCRHLVTS